MVGTLVHQLTKGVSPEVLKREGLGEYYTDHGISVYPQSAAGIPFSASAIAVKGDPIADLTEDLAAEQKARATYEYLIDLADDPDVIDVLRFLREREVVHFQRFGEALRTVQEKLAEKRFYMNGNMGINSNNNNNNTTYCSNAEIQTSCPITNNIKTESSCACANSTTSNNINNGNSAGNCNCGK